MEAPQDLAMVSLVELFDLVEMEAFILIENL